MLLPARSFDRYCFSPCLLKALGVEVLLESGVLLLWVVLLSLSIFLVEELIGRSLVLSLKLCPFRYLPEALPVA